MASASRRKRRTGCGADRAHKPPCLGRGSRRVERGRAAARGRQAHLHAVLARRRAGRPRVGESPPRLTLPSAPRSAGADGVREGRGGRAEWCSGKESGQAPPALRRAEARGRGRASPLERSARPALARRAREAGRRPTRHRARRPRRQAAAPKYLPAHPPIRPPPPRPPRLFVVDLVHVGLELLPHLVLQHRLVALLRGWGGGRKGGGRAPSPSGQWPSVAASESGALLPGPSRPAFGQPAAGARPPPSHPPADVLRQDEEVLEQLGRRGRRGAATGAAAVDARERRAATGLRGARAGVTRDAPSSQRPP
jgi:hypothetical protein